MDGIERIDIVSEYCNRYPKLCKFWYGPTIELFTNDPDLIKLCFNNPLNSRKPRSYEYFFYGNGLVTAEGNETSLMLNKITCMNNFL